MLNNVCIMGRLVAEPELKKTQNDISVCGFAIACDRPSRKDAEREVDFIDITAWRNTADFICKWFRKGDPIIIEGRIQTRLYTDRDGNKRKAVEILAEKVNFAGNKREDRPEEQRPAQDPVQGKPAPDVGTGWFEIDEGDLPF